MTNVHMLFADDLAQAIAEGRKTVTRRPVTRSNTLLDGGPCRVVIWGSLDWDAVHLDPGPSPAGNAGPYLKVAAYRDGDEFRHRLYPRWSPGDLLIVRECFRFVGNAMRVQYRAATPSPEGIKWTPSVHMPRRAVRSVRRIVDVRPELVGPDSLGRDEARCEGFDSQAAFGETWAKIYGTMPRWVWRVEFDQENVQ